MPHTVPVAFSSYAGMDVGRDNGLVVDPRLRRQRPLRRHRNGEKGGVRPQPATNDDERALHEHAQVQAIGQGAAG